MFVFLKKGDVLMKLEPFNYEDWVLLFSGNYGSNLTEKQLKKEYKEHVKHVKKCEREYARKNRKQRKKVLCSNILH